MSERKTTPKRRTKQNRSYNPNRAIKFNNMKEPGHENTAFLGSVVSTHARTSTNSRKKPIQVEDEYQTTNMQIKDPDNNVQTIIAEQNKVGGYVPQTKSIQAREENGLTEIVEKGGRDNTTTVRKIYLATAQLDVDRAQNQLTHAQLRKQFLDLGLEERYPHFNALTDQELQDIIAEHKQTPKHITKEEFTKHLKASYDLIDFNERRGGMIPIPKLRNALNKEGVSNTEFDKMLFELEKDRVIDLQIASDPKLLKEPEKAIQHPSRGYINYVVWRK